MIAGALFGMVGIVCNPLVVCGLCAALTLLCVCGLVVAVIDY